MVARGSWGTLGLPRSSPTLAPHDKAAFPLLPHQFWFL